jgi:guanylate kinase
VRQRGVPVTSVFVLPPSYRILAQRLRGRSKDSDAAIRRRLAVARDEVRCYADYDYVVVNDTIDEAVRRLEAIVAAERARTPAMRPVAEDIARTFEEGLEAEPQGG